MQMGIGKICDLAKSEELGIGYVNLSRSCSFGRKRVFISPTIEEVDSSFMTPKKKKKNCDGDSVLSSPVEALPQDILIRILCGVEHDDLKTLFNVSKSVRAATVIAKEWHFEYSTPTKKLAFRNGAEVGNWGDNQVETPNAPKQLRIPKSRLIGTKKQESFPRTVLFRELETEI